MMNPAALRADPVGISGPPPKQEEGEFTRMFNAGRPSVAPTPQFPQGQASLPDAPPAQPVVEAKKVGEFTQMFGRPQAPAAPAGPPPPSSGFGTGGYGAGSYGATGVFRGTGAPPPTPQQPMGPALDSPGESEYTRIVRSPMGGGAGGPAGAAAGPGGPAGGAGGAGGGMPSIPGVTPPKFSGPAMNVQGPAAGMQGGHLMAHGPHVQEIGPHMQQPMVHEPNMAMQGPNLQAGMKGLKMQGMKAPKLGAPPKIGAPELSAPAAKSGPNVLLIVIFCLAAFLVGAVLMYLFVKPKAEPAPAQSAPAPAKKGAIVQPYRVRQG